MFESRRGAVKGICCMALTYLQIPTEEFCFNLGIVCMFTYIAVLV